MLCMNPSDTPKAASSAELADAEFAREVCLPFLRDQQKEDGGWGYHVGLSSRVEPTCWALLALMQVDSTAAQHEVLERGLRFLRASQLPDGSWPATPQEKTGCWVTSLACWVLCHQGDAGVAAGLRWLCQDWPRDSSPWQRLLKRFRSEHIVSPQNDAYRGWGWTPRTSSWVEPTSLALILLREVSQQVLPQESNKRKQLAEAMLYDRICPGGGWNCGNPKVYGVPGEPLVIPTAWALLALSEHANRRENQMSLDWVVRTVPSIQSPASLALARMCMETYQRNWPLREARLSAFHNRHAFLRSIPVTAWICLAWNPRPKLFGSAARRV